MSRAVTVLLAVDEATSGLTDDDRHFAAAVERRFDPTVADRLAQHVLNDTA